MDFAKTISTPFVSFILILPCSAIWEYISRWKLNSTFHICFSPQLIYCKFSLGGFPYEKELLFQSHVWKLPQSRSASGVQDKLKKIIMGIRHARNTKMKKISVKLSLCSIQVGKSLSGMEDTYSIKKFQLP